MLSFIYGFHLFTLKGESLNGALSFKIERTCSVADSETTSCFWIILKVSWKVDFMVALFPASCCRTENIQSCFLFCAGRCHITHVIKWQDKHSYFNSQFLLKNALPERRVDHRIRKLSCVWFKPKSSRQKLPNLIGTIKFTILKRVPYWMINLKI